MSERKKTVKRTPKGTVRGRSTASTTRGKAGATKSKSSSSSRTAKSGTKSSGTAASRSSTSKTKTTTRTGAPKKAATKTSSRRSSSKRAPTSGTTTGKRETSTESSGTPARATRARLSGKKPTAKNAPTLVAPPRRRAAAPAKGNSAPVSEAESDSEAQPAEDQSANRGAKTVAARLPSAPPKPDPSTESLPDKAQRAALSTPSVPPAGVDGVYEGDSDDDDPVSDPYPMSAVDLDMLGIGSPLFPPDNNLGEEDDTYDSTDWNGEASASSFSLGEDPSVEMRIREIEDRLEGLMAKPPHDDLDVEPSPAPQAVAPGDTTSDAIDSAREVLESDYYRKKWGQGSLSKQSYEVDDFGLDPNFVERVRPGLEFLFKKYFRVEVEGIRNVPSEGRAVVVANHSGALPFDGVMLGEAIRERHSARDDFRWLAEDFSFYLPFLGVAMNRIGAVRACPENAERLLAQNKLVGVFPEGAEGTKKLFKNRYRLQRFGRGGFVRLCLKTRSPIVPCAIIGAEETNPILYRFDNLSKLLGLDYLPITPTFPLLGPLGLIPAPTKWKIIFGEAISVDEYGPQAAQDHVLVGQLSERVRSSINGLLETSLRKRKSIWL